MQQGNPHSLEHCTPFDPLAPFDAFLKSVPAKGAVYLLADAEDRPVQLLCVANLRYSLKRRLGGDEIFGPSKRVNYREIVRRIYWRRVDSPFEADWAYYEAARVVFPLTYQGMVGFRPAWFVHVNPDAEFPRYAKTIDLTSKPGIFVGPVEDKHTAGRLTELVEDAFDLCRYYNVLVEAPRGKACAYKEMGKCPAPCDGSISMEQYRRMVEWSTKTIVDPQDFVREQTRRMEQAAAELKFESAAKIKAFIAQIATWGKGPYRYLRRLEDFVYLSLQRGPGAATAKVFLITPGKIEELADLIDEPARPAELLRTVLSAAEERRDPLDQTAVERIGVVAHHLFQAKQTHGVFLPLSEISEKAVVKAYKDLQKQKQKEQPEESEGVTKELGGIE